MLYGADVRGESINASLLAEENRQLADPTRRANSWEYAKQIVTGIAEHGDEIDELIETYSQGWTIERMPAVDRAIIRIGIWELAVQSRGSGGGRNFGGRRGGTFAVN